MCLFFHADLPVAVGAGASGLVTADLNMDHLIDAAIADTTSHELVVLTGNGFGGFATRTQLKLGAAPTSLVVNPSGAVQVAVGPHGELDTVSWSGDAFQVTHMPRALPQGTDLLGFVSGPETGELLVANVPRKTLAVVGGTSERALPDTPEAVTSAALGGAGTDSAIVATLSGVTIVPVDASGDLLAGQTYTTLSGAKSVVAADFNHDGNIDLALATNADGFTTLSVLLNNGAGGLVPFGTYGVDYVGGTAAPAIAAAHFVSATTTDAVIADSNGVYVLLGDGHGGFSQEVTAYYAPAYEGYGVPVGVAVATLTPGGRPDILVTLSSGYVDVIHTGTKPLAAHRSPFQHAAVSGTGSLELTLSVGAVLALRSVRPLARRRWGAIRRLIRWCARNAGADLSGR